VKQNLAKAAAKGKTAAVNAGAQRGWFVTYKLTIDQKPGYLRLAVTGRNSSENVVRYMEELFGLRLRAPIRASA